MYFTLIDPINEIIINKSDNLHACYINIKPQLCNWEQNLIVLGDQVSGMILLFLILSTNRNHY